MPGKYPSGAVPFNLWKKVVCALMAKTEARAYLLYCFIASNG
jgi:hypothetical protein